MSGIKYLADTNAILYFLLGNECMRPYMQCDFALSVISEMELLSYPSITDEEESRIRTFLERCVVINISDAIKRQTIILRRNYRIKLPDSMIAATAIENRLTLITADVGFTKIDGLRLERIKPIA